MFFNPSLAKISFLPRSLQSHHAFFHLSILHPASLQSSRYCPTIPLKNSDAASSSDLLISAGFIRQSSSGLWSLLPNALRVLHKIESIIRLEINAIGASEISMPLLQNSSLWKKSGRWNQAGHELFRLVDRKGSSLLLSPTHEEEITQLIKNDLLSTKHLPLKLFHIGRKFRDEPRPRAGLLRSREFIMKDLYTFDSNQTNALKSYHQVQLAYKKIFNTIGLPITIAEADSGAIGGSKSHEYHFKSNSGEDTLVHCPQCSSTFNQELAQSILSPNPNQINQTQVKFYFLPNSTTLLAVLLPLSHAIHPLKLAKIHPQHQLVSFDTFKPNFQLAWDQLHVLIDQSCTTIDIQDIYQHVSQQLSHILNSSTSSQHLSNHPSHPKLDSSPLPVWPSLPTYSIHDVRNVSTDLDSNSSSTPHKFEELCVKCGSKLEFSSAIEVAHTFYLGTKYSASLNATFNSLDSTTGQQVTLPFEMGCYGIGVSRLISAIAECYRIENKLRWPINIAPFKICLIIPPTQTVTLDILSLATTLARNLETNLPDMLGEVLIDDRNQRIGWKLNDAELIGYPILIILGNKWINNGIMEIRNQFLNTTTEIDGISFSKKDNELCNLEPLISKSVELLESLKITY
ncbi:hypothetical protein O181_003739 [Austropuccinia psidii MF-1]|uniref:proline--tRNA ligase n=1 Tax=Austropuccinia psidii MF-1 TaxID=1389203 RepID=A0A9Q3BEJ7_9BASI|nr:hypothetical protein [Austropuccinia psidii MF-1]